MGISQGQEINKCCAQHYTVGWWQTSSQNPGLQAGVLTKCFHVLFSFLSNTCTVSTPNNTKKLNQRAVPCPICIHSYSCPPGSNHSSLFLAVSSGLYLCETHHVSTSSLISFRYFRDFLWTCNYTRGVLALTPLHSTFLSPSLPHGCVTAPS